MRKQKVTISVIGSHDAAGKKARKAYQVGALIAELGATLVCGGLGGVMEQAAKGAQEHGGMTIGLLPGRDKKDANPYIDLALPTSIGYARNCFVASCADIVIALEGSHGTNCEICYGLVFKRPVIDFGGWGIKGMIKAHNMTQLRQKIQRLMNNL